MVNPRGLSFSTVNTNLSFLAPKTDVLRASASWPRIRCRLYNASGFSAHFPVSCGSKIPLTPFVLGFWQMAVIETRTFSHVMQQVLFIEQEHPSHGFFGGLLSLISSCVFFCVSSADCSTSRPFGLPSCRSLIASMAF